MVSAIGTFAAQRLQLQNTLDVQTRLEQAQIQLSSGKVSQSFDGVSQDARRLLDLERSQVANDAFQQNVKQADLRMEETANVVDDLESIASRFQQQLVAANTDTNVENLSIQSTAENFREEIAGLLNTDLAGRQLFSGTAVDRQSVDFSGLNLGDVASGDHFQGNGQSIETRVTENLDVESNVSADPTQRTGIQELITATTRVIEADESNLNAAIDGALNDLNGSNVQTSTTRIANPGTTLDNVEDPAGNAIISGNGTLDITTSDGTTASINVDATGGTSETIQDVVTNINSNASNVTARLEDSSSGTELVIQPRGNESITGITDNGGLTFNGDLGLGQREQPGAIERLAQTSADIGSRRQTLTASLNRLESDSSQNEQAVGEIENVDVTEAATEMSALQNTLQASFASSARLQNLSILNFLR